MTSELWLAVLSSSLISGVVGALIAGWFALRTKRHEYTNDYFKHVLGKRLAAYEDVERVTVMLRTAVLGEDQRPYHLLFAQPSEDVYKLLLNMTVNAFWLSGELFEKTRQLTVLLYSHAPTSGTLVSFAQEHYRTLAELRTAVERVHAQDMLTLHDVPHFLKRKNPTDGYVQVTRGGSQATSSE
jgi:hypothetical protein